MTDRVFNVLFLCTGNSARSIIAETILNKDGRGRFRAYSGGSEPRGQVHPLTLQILESFGYSTEGLRSKSWNEFALPDAPCMDFVFTVCDSAAGETCPVWPGQPMSAHWGIDDPAAVEGTVVEKTAAFVTAARYLRNRISVFTSLPLDKLDEIVLRPRLIEIGQMEGASTPNPKVA
ncbi:MAG: arsenate reductase ArsC [Rhizobiales bacterium]|nr:arsenate reductase ArsC [Hyphomicrobiales bacterium]